MAFISNKQLYVNQSIEIEVKKGPNKGTFPSKIEEVTNDYVKVLPPYQKNGVVPIKEKTDLDVFFTGEDAAYKFSSQVLDQVEENVELLVIAPPQDIVRIQRRDYFRLEAKRDAKYRKLDEDLESDEEYIETKTIDLSGGGVRIVIEDVDLEEGDMVELMLDIPDIEDVEILGEVMQKYDLPNGKAAGIEFKQIARHVRDQIIGWLFDYQRELRRKGLL